LARLSRLLEKIPLAGGIVEFRVRAPMVARSAKAGQFVRVLGWHGSELIPLTLADWDAETDTKFLAFGPHFCC
jgi:glutamate synthase (NADPH/NADH) small chain